MECETSQAEGPGEDPDSGLERAVSDEENQQPDRACREENSTALKYSQRKAKAGKEDREREVAEREIEMLERWYSVDERKNNNSSKRGRSNSGSNDNKTQYEIRLLERMLASSPGNEDPKDEGDKDSKDKDSPHGSLGFIFHKDKKTGVTEYLVEQPQLGKYDAGKIKLLGGHKKVGESFGDAIRREVGEEVSSPAKDILLAGDFVYYTTMNDVVNGKVVQTAVYEREIKSDAEWKIVKSAYGTHDAGNISVLSAHTLLGLGNEYYAYGNNWARMFKDFVRETSGLEEVIGRLSKSALKHSFPISNYHTEHGYNPFFKSALLPFQP
ncbi:hypothetical protein HYY71_01595 [Candidatus Woesearchaeota archaeon]|nr:hypothetical protein [Candidatus Woesearchaeota archaeon]